VPVRRDQLEHLIRAAGAILGDDDIIVIGSQSLVGATAGPLPPLTMLSIEADLLPLDDADGTKLDLIDGTIGEFSMFHESFGIYAQGVAPTTARLAEGWRDRLVALHNDNTRGVTGWCLDPTDLVVAKLLASRPKDIEFCGSLVEAGVVLADDVRLRLVATDATPAEIELIHGLLRRWNHDVMDT
jgi:hypothetical protein